MVKTILRRVCLGWLILIVWPMSIPIDYLMSKNTLSQSVAVANEIVVLFWNGESDGESDGN